MNHLPQRYDRPVEKKIADAVEHAYSTGFL